MLGLKFLGTWAAAALSVFLASLGFNSAGRPNLTVSVAPPANGMAASAPPARSSLPTLLAAASLKVVDTEGMARQIPKGGLKDLRALISGRIPGHRRIRIKLNSRGRSIEDFAFVIPAIQIKLEEPGAGQATAWMPGSDDLPEFDCDAFIDETMSH